MDASVVTRYTCRHMASIAEHVRESGAKLTGPRREIIEYIENLDGIFAAAQIAKALKPIDTVSVYRTLQLLKELDMIHPSIVFEGEQYYELHGHEDHHHHAVCTSCREARCVECKISVSKLKGFTVNDHNLVLTGLCSSCK